MLIVTHDHGFARRAANRVVELVAGRVVRQGSAADLLE
jgi:ABC-type polar amino acid transport system ATPase subunit